MEREAERKRFALMNKQERFRNKFLKSKVLLLKDKRFKIRSRSPVAP